MDIAKSDVVRSAAGRDKGKLRGGIFQALLALGLLALGVVSGISIWL